MTKYLTVVYAIDDMAAFEPERKRLAELFVPEAKGAFQVTAMSASNEIHRIELIEQVLQGDDRSEIASDIQAILDHASIDSVQTLEEALDR